MPIQINPTTWKEIAKDDPRDRLEVIIGDDKQPDFKPQIKIERWDDEVNFSVRLDENISGATFKQEEDKVVWSKGNIDIEYYNYPEGEGGMKMVWYLKEKPLTNKVKFTMQSKGLNFYRQPALTEEYQNGYSKRFRKEIVVSETQVKDLDGNVLVERPEEYVDSWAIYTSEQKINWVDGKIYKNGKFGHIKRIKLVDANGWQVWGHLDISKPIEIIGDTEISNYSVEIPQEFLDKAIYPIKSNDNFGFESFGTTEGAGWGDYMVFNEPGYTGGAGTGVSMSIYTKSFGSEDHEMALYTESGGTYSLVTNGSTDAVSVDTTAKWWTANFTSAPTLSAVNYKLMGNCPNGYQAFFADSVPDDQTEYSKAQTYGTWPATFTSPSTESITDKISIYATYTPAAGDVVATPSVVTLTASVQAPSASGEAQVSPAVQQLTSSIQSPSVTGEGGVSPVVQSLVASVQTPSVTGKANAGVGVQSLTTSIQSPSAAGKANAGVIVQELTTSIPTPSASGEGGVSPAVQTLVASIQSPSATGEANVITAVQSLIASIQTPSATGKANAIAAVQSLVVSVIAPTATVAITVVRILRKKVVLMTKGATSVLGTIGRTGVPITTGKQSLLTTTNKKTILTTKGRETIL